MNKYDEALDEVKKLVTMGLGVIDSATMVSIYYKLSIDETRSILDTVSGQGEEVWVE